MFRLISGENQTIYWLKGITCTEAINFEIVILLTSLEEKGSSDDAIGK
jgi:hypothetical protein